jgi:hypothetical protein
MQEVRIYLDPRHAKTWVDDVYWHLLYSKGSASSSRLAVRCAIFANVCFAIAAKLLRNAFSECVERPETSSLKRTCGAFRS